MFGTLLRAVALLGLGLSAGGALCILFLDRAQGANPSLYVESKQLMIRALTVPLPVLGGVGLVAALADGVLLWRAGLRGASAWVFAAAVVGLVAILTTRFGHFPLNAQLLQWDPAQPPSGWMEVRNRWEALHRVRTLASTASFALLAFGDALLTRTVK